MHTHQTLVLSTEQQARNGTNKIIPAPPNESVFSGISEQYGLSPVARQFIAGQLFHAKSHDIGAGTDN